VISVINSFSESSESKEMKQIRRLVNTDSATTSSGDGPMMSQSSTDTWQAFRVIALLMCSLTCHSRILSRDDCGLGRFLYHSVGSWPVYEFLSLFFSLCYFHCALLVIFAAC